jgi:hypothetical protein
MRTPICDDDATPQARPYRGWSAQGIARYNQQFTEIELERQNKTYLEFEKYCMKTFQEEAEADRKTKYKHRKMEPDRQIPGAKHQVWEDDNKEEEHLGKENELKLPFRMKGTVVAL